MTPDFAIIPECYTDTNLIETIVSPQRGYNHQMGCNKVTGVMQTKLNDRFALGIIDKDKREVKYLDEFEIIVQLNKLTLLKHKSKHHYIIQICPAIESFILEEANQLNFDLNDFELPSNLSDFKKVTKTRTSKFDKKLKRLFLELIKANSPSLKTLSKWIGYLKQKGYNANLEEIKNL